MIAVNPMQVRKGETMIFLALQQHDWEELLEGTDQTSW